MQVKLYLHRFSPSLPEMRIAIEYQFSDRNYTVLSPMQKQHDSKKWSLELFVSENDCQETNPCSW
jgi:hypothetical protein